MRKLFSSVSLLVVFFVWGVLPPNLWALELLDDDSLACVDAQAGPITVSVEQNTNMVRLFFDTYIETYIEADNIRLGYYYKDKEDLVTRKGMNPGVPFGTGADPRLIWNQNNANPDSDGHKTFRVNYQAYKHNGSKGGKTDPRYAMEYVLENGHGQTTEFVPWTDDDLYMAKYKSSKGNKMWVDGAIGDNYAYFCFSKRSYQNRNYLDWDVNLNNVRLGGSPDNPAKINGLVVRLKYNDLSASNPRLTDIIIGTNDIQGDLMLDFVRATGFFSPKNAYRSRRTTLQNGYNGIAETDLGQEFNITPVPVVLQRDPMLTLVDHFYFGRDYRDPTGTAFMTANPDNPTNSNTHSGVFLRIGLDRSSPHFGFNLVTGYNEMVASAFEYRGEHINESLYRWWNGIEDPPGLNDYPSYLPSGPYLDSGDYN